MKHWLGTGAEQSIMVSLIKRLMPKASLILTDDDKEETYFQMFLWSLGFTDSTQLYANMAAFARQCKPDTGLRPSLEMKNWISAYRWRVFGNDDVTRLKLAVLHLCFEEVIDDERTVGRYLRSRGLPDDCAILISYLVKDRVVWKQFKLWLRDCLQQPGVINELLVDWRVLIDQCNKDFDQFNVKTQARKLAAYKMRFIADSNRMQPEDLANDLIERAVAYYYRERPLKTRLHCVNYAKSSLKGRTNQLITYWTNPERSLYVKDSFGSNLSRNIVLTEEAIDVYDAQNTEPFNQSAWMGN